MSDSKNASEYMAPYTMVGDTAQSSDVMRAAQSDMPAAYAGMPGAVYAQISLISWGSIWNQWGL